MKQLIKAFGDSIIGVTSGFDRIVFQGMIRPLMYPEGAIVRATYPIVPLLSQA